MTRVYVALLACLLAAFGALVSSLGRLGLTLGFVLVAVVAFLVASAEAGRVQRGRS